MNTQWHSISKSCSSVTQSLRELSNASETLTDGHRPKTTRKYSEEALDSNPWVCDWWSAHPSSLTRYLAEQNMPNPSCKIWVTEKSWATGRPKSPHNPLGFSILSPGPRLHVETEVLTWLTEKMIIPSLDNTLEREEGEICNSVQPQQKYLTLVNDTWVFTIRPDWHQAKTAKLRISLRQLYLGHHPKLPILVSTVLNCNLDSDYLLLCLLIYWCI